jgi:ribosomal protein S17E
MSYSVITGIAIAIAVVVVIGIGLLSYMSSLIKNAYQIKVELRNDLETGLKKVEEDVRQKSKWMRNEVGEDVAKMKQALERENGERLAGLQERFQTAVRDLDEAGRAERAEMRGAIAGAHRKLQALEQDIAAMREEAARRAALGRPTRKDRGDGTAEGGGREDHRSDAARAEAAAAAMDSLAAAAPDPPQRPSSSASPSSLSPASPVAGDVTEAASGGTQRFTLQDFDKKAGPVQL